MKIKQNFRQAGTTLLEVTFVLAIISVIGLGALAFYKMTSDDARINEGVNNLGVLSGKIQLKYRTQGNYTGVNIPAIVKVAPKGMRNGTNTTTLKTGWNTDGVRITPERLGTISGDSFGISFLGLPDVDCESLADQTLDKFTKVVINGTTVYDFSPGNSLNLGVSGVASACGNSDNNTVMWIAR